MISTKRSLKIRECGNSEVVTLPEGFLQAMKNKNITKLVGLYNEEFIIFAPKENLNKVKLKFNL